LEYFINKKQIESCAEKKRDASLLDNHFDEKKSIKALKKNVYRSNVEISI
jgi:hypothetical protein